MIVNGRTLGPEAIAQMRKASHKAVRTIRDYWAVQGYDVDVEYSQTRHGMPVISDMINGWPRYKNDQVNRRIQKAA